MKLVTVDELKKLQKSIPAYVKYLLRLDVYDTMSEMARDLGVSDGYVRKIRYRETHK